MSYTYKHTFFKTKTGDMKITIFHLMDLPYFSTCVSFRSMTSKAVFHRTCPWHCCALFVFSSMGREAESSVSGHLSGFLPANPPAKAFASQKCMSLKPYVVISLFCRNWVESMTERACFCFLVQGELH